jgi:hypothetical protein
MSDAAEIRSILLDRDIAAFVARSWESVRADFDAHAFVGYSGEHGGLQAQFPSLESYRDAWLAQACEWNRADPRELAEQLHAVQRIVRLEISKGRAIATKVFDGELRLTGHDSQRLEWTTYYFLRHDDQACRWLITGFVGYLPPDWRPL